MNAEEVLVEGGSLFERPSQRFRAPTDRRDEACALTQRSRADPGTKLSTTTAMTCSRRPGRLPQGAGRRVRARRGVRLEEESICRTGPQQCHWHGRASECHCHRWTMFWPPKRNDVTPMAPLRTSPLEGLLSTLRPLSLSLERERERACLPSGGFGSRRREGGGCEEASAPWAWFGRPWR